MKIAQTLALALTVVGIASLPSALKAQNQVAASSTVSSTVSNKVSNTASNKNDARARMMQLTGDLHGSVSPIVVAKNITDEEYRVLLDIARDTKAPIYNRMRAISLAGVRLGEASEKLWAEARQYPESELREQAAWAQATARRKTAEILPFLQKLLQEQDVKMREIAIHHLYLLKSDADLKSQAINLLKSQSHVEKDAVLQKLLQRRLAELSA